MSLEIIYTIECSECNFVASIKDIAEGYEVSYCPSCGEETLEYYSIEVDDDPL